VVVLLTEDDANAAAAVCRQVLPRYWQPRLVFTVSNIPLTGTGKPARAEAESMAEKLRGE
jgi:O-succinylbenzoic acid--CoA ligase